MDKQEVEAAVLSSSIPGESLTAELGAYPWQRPPELPTIDEAVSYYSERLVEDKTSAGFIALLDSGISIKTIIDTTLEASIAHGIHSIDVATLVSPVLVEMMMYLGDVAKVDYITGLEEDKRNKVVENAVMYKVMKKFSDEAKDVEKPTEMPEVETPMAEAPKGLMARPTPSVNEGVM